MCSRYDDLAWLDVSYRSGGSAISFGVDAVATHYLNELLANFVMLMVALTMCGVVMMSIKEHNEVIVDVADGGEVEEKRSDSEVVEEVVTVPILAQ